MHIHILGICGTFMGGVAAIAREAGFRVTGCDANVYPPMSEQLSALGIDLIEGFDAEQVKLNPDIYVVGNMVSRGKQPLMEEILNRGLPYTSGPQWLADNVLRDKWVLAGAGTHGKTTTTSMLGLVLIHAGQDPTVIVGGKLHAFGGTNARLGRGEFMVVEADEFDRSFLQLNPVIAVLTTLEEEHLDIYANLEDLEQAFIEFAGKVPFYGFVTLCLDEPALQEILPRIAATLAETGRSRADFEVSFPPFVVTGATEAEFEAAKQQVKYRIAFYGSTPAYRPVLECHGWGDLQPKLNQLSKNNGWERMPELIGDEMLETFAVVGEPRQVATEIRRRYGHLVDRLTLENTLPDDQIAEQLRVIRG